jgi:hypothetical protein
MHKTSSSWDQEGFTATLTKLRNLQKEFESKQDYGEANKIEEQIQKVKLSHRIKTVRKLRMVQRKERHSIDLKYQKDKQDFQENWEDRIKMISDKFKCQKEELRDRHATFIEKEKKDLEKNVPFIFKPSSQLLNLIACKEKAVLAKKYKEAQKMTQEIQETLEFEKNYFVEQRNAKINKQLNIFKAKLEKEVAALEIKQETELSEIKKIMDLEREGMEKKVENICRELENAQNIQVNIVKGLHTTNAGRQSPAKPGSARDQSSSRFSNSRRASPKPRIVK